MPPKRRKRLPPRPPMDELAPLGTESPPLMPRRASPLVMGAGSAIRIQRAPRIGAGLGTAVRR